MYSWMMTDDMELVREYAACQSERAFETLVGRHINLVYASALRQVGNTHLAEEITQAVFIILARKAKSLGPHTILAAWLYRTTRYAAADALKSERRRQRREQEAYMDSLSNKPEQDGWEQIAPLLDEGIAQLVERDRSALVMRFFENKTAREIGLAQRVDEAAAQKRVARALDKLRGFFLARGVTLSATAIAASIAANAAQAAPAGLALCVVAAAKGSAATASTLALAKGVLKVMAWTKAKTAVVTGVVLILATGTTVIVKNSMDPKSRAAASIERVREANVGLPTPQVQAKMLIMSAIVQRRIPDSSNWCETLNAGGKIWPASTSNVFFAVNSKMAGRAYTPGFPSDLVVFFETSKPGWNQAGGPELLAKKTEGVAIGFADGSATIVPPDEVPKLRWTL